MKITETPYHRWLCKQRGYCEDKSPCFNDPKVVRKIDGHDKTFCYEHDPENGFEDWLTATGQHLDNEDFTAWLKQREDTITV